MKQFPLKQEKMTHPKLEIAEASLHVFAAFDIGFEVRMSQIPVLFGSRTRDPAGYSFLSRSIGRETQPIRIALDSVEIKIQGRLRHFKVFATFFDVGALSLEYICPLDENFHELPKLAAFLQSSADIAAESRRLAEEIYSIAKPATVNPEFFGQPSMYTIFNIKKLKQPAKYEAIVSELGAEIAKTLRLSDEPIGASEIQRTLNPFITYSDEDIVFAASHVAIVFDETSSEVIDIFELINVQAHELKFIDARLDRTLQGLYDETGGKKTSWRSVPSLLEKQSKRLNTIHLDSTIIVERVEQIFKFATDSHLVRIHELGVSRMFLASLGRGIDRKLAAIRDIMSDRRDRASSTRMEVLEWIIIALIAFDVVPKVIKILYNGLVSIGIFPS